MCASVRKNVCVCHRLLFHSPLNPLVRSARILCTHACLTYGLSLCLFVRPSVRLLSGCISFDAILDPGLTPYLPSRTAGKQGRISRPSRSRTKSMSNACASGHACTRSSGSWKPKKSKRGLLGGLGNINRHSLFHYVWWWLLHPCL